MEEKLTAIKFRLNLNVEEKRRRTNKSGFRWCDHSAFKCGVCGDIVHTTWRTDRHDKTDQYCDYCTAKTGALYDDDILQNFVLYNGSKRPKKTFL